MSEDEFEAEVLDHEVVVVHMGDGHTFHFPILSNGTVSLHGTQIEPQPRREARRYLPEAHNAARTAFGRSQA
jgi:hypothetical protein